MCSLEEAFSNFVEHESRNNEWQDKKRKKKRKTVLPPEPAIIEPDRPAHRPLPPAELLGGPPTENKESTSVSLMLNAYDSADHYPHPNSEINEETVYNLEPDWTKAFNNTSAPEWIKDRMAQRSAEVPLTPSPWLDGSSTLWQQVPNALKLQAGLEDAKDAAESRLDEMQKKLESMFRKMEDLETTRAESNHLELILFVLGGIFILLMLDLLVKQGTQATMLIAAAGGSLGASRFVQSFRFP